jgi:hypothetical protein
MEVIIHGDVKEYIYGNFWSSNLDSDPELPESLGLRIRIL